MWRSGDSINLTTEIPRRDLDFHLTMMISPDDRMIPTCLADTTTQPLNFDVFVSE